MNKSCPTPRVFITAIGFVLLIGYFSFHSVLVSDTFHQQAYRQKNIRSLTGGHSNPEKVLEDQGLEYLTNTAQLLPEFVGAKINCTNCHLQGGTTPGAAPWVGVSFRFPQYRNRTGQDVDLADRINDCFERSLNGKVLPKNHPAMKAMLAYMKSLSPNADVKGRGIQKLKLARAPDLTHGAQVYENKCAQCHQKEGQGQIVEGKIVYPPLWGKDSFNIAAGMARLHTAAGFAKHNMPLGQGDSLSDEEAWDVAAYFSTQPRPDFARKHLDWPKGKKPEDARY